MAVLQLPLATDTESSVWCLLCSYEKLIKQTNLRTANRYCCGKPVSSHSDLIELTPTKRNLTRAILFIISPICAGWGGAAGRIDVTPCPGPGQIVCINAEMGRLYPFRPRSGREETAETESRSSRLDMQGGVEPSACGILDLMTGKTARTVHCISLSTEHLLPV